VSGQLAPYLPEAHVRHAIDDADRQLGVARSVISGHRGWIGADARTRLAEAERLRLDLAQLAATPIGEDDREQALADARRCGQLAAEALQLAQRDIDSSRPNDGGWGGPVRRGAAAAEATSPAASWAASSSVDPGRHLRLIGPQSDDTNRIGRARRGIRLRFAIVLSPRRRAVNASGGEFLRPGGALAVSEMTP
jgi:hypothetical protein